MKIRRLPLPTPWTANAAVLHLYGAWTNRGQAPLKQIHLSNPNMIHALMSLCEQQKEDKGILAGIGTWRLRRELNGTATIVINHHESAMTTTRR